MLALRVIRLAAKALPTPRYDGLIANWLGARTGDAGADTFAPSLHLAAGRAKSHAALR